MREEKDRLDPESFIPGLEKGTKQYKEVEAFCRGIDEDFNPDIRISAKVKERLLDYEIVSTQPWAIDSEMSDHIKDQFCMRKDISFADLLSDREREIIANFRTPEGDIASWPDPVDHLSSEIDGLCLNKRTHVRTPKGEAAFRYYLATRRPEELGSEFVEDAKLYRKHLKHYEKLCKAVPYDYYKHERRPESKYWQLVWDALDYCEISTFTSEKILKDRPICELLNFQPLDPKFLDSGEWCSPDEFIKLGSQIIKEAGGKRIDENIHGVETAEELVRQMQWDFLDAITRRDNELRRRLNHYKTFWIVFFLRNKRRYVYDYYLKRTKSALNKLKRIEIDAKFEEFEYLDLKARLEGDLLFACVFHDYIRGGERYLRIPRGEGRPKKERIEEALKYAKPWIGVLKEFGIKHYKRKGMLLLNALAKREIYSTTQDVKITSTLPYNRGRSTGLKSKGEKRLAKELRRLKKSS